MCRNALLSFIEILKNPNGFFWTLEDQTSKMVDQVLQIPVARTEYIMRGEHDIETERLIMTPFHADDLHLLHRTFTDSFVRKYLWDDQVITLDETKKNSECQ